MSIFSSCTLAPPDPILNLSVAFKKDSNPRKVDLGVGAYRDETGRPLIFKAVRQAQEMILKDLSDTHEYTTIEGPANLKPLCLELMFGSVLTEKYADKIASAQSISGTGALRLAAEFIALHCGNNKQKIVYVSDPTWGNHVSIFKKAGLTVEHYPYWDPVKKGVDIEGCLNKFESIESGSVVLLHACAHNPTGCDPSETDIVRLVAVIARRKLIAVADSAYQGYASGDLEKDSFMLRKLLDSGCEFFITQSFAKNMGLYGERFGMIHIVTSSSDTAVKVMSQLKLIVRPMYSSPPIHGAKIALKVLSDKSLYESWLAELRAVSHRISRVRNELSFGLEQAGCGDWSHVRSQIGMFSFTGLTPAQVDRMINHWHIYMLQNGRISLAGLNENNISYVIEAIRDCVSNP